MQITILSDNRPGRQELKTEHGLSILIKTDDKCILGDTGASSLYAENALAMGIDLSETDFCFSPIISSSPKYPTVLSMKR